MAEYTCEFSKTSDDKYVQVPNENNDRRTQLKVDSKYHTPLRNLDKYKIKCEKTTYEDGEEIKDTVTYVREFKSDVTSSGVIYCAFTSGASTIYIKHDDLTSKAKEDEKKYPVYTYTNPNYTEDIETTYTFGWLL